MTNIKWIIVIGIMLVLSMEKGNRIVLPAEAHNTIGEIPIIEYFDDNSLTDDIDLVIQYYESIRGCSMWWEILLVWFRMFVISLATGIGLGLGFWGAYAIINKHEKSK